MLGTVSCAEGRIGKAAWRALAATVLVTAIVSRPAAAQTPPPAPPADAPEWTVGIAGAWYLLPDEPDFLQPTIRLDRSWLHLESRYAYEDQESLSFFGGANLAFGSGDVTLTVTPMIGGLVGRVDGVVPGLELGLSAWRLGAYAEAEYVFDLDDTASQYFYMWSEVSLQATDWLRAGLVTQRTRVYRTDRDIQRGLLVGVSLPMVESTFYWFNPGAGDQFAVLSLGVSF
jgi:hypothetical protein